MRIALDAMGGDHAPSEVVKGAVMAAREYGVEIILVGRQAAIQAELAKHDTTGLTLPIEHADDIVEMHEHPVAAVKAKPRSSIVVAMQLVKKRQADAIVSAGNSGAAVASGLFVLGRIRGIERPAISAIVPTFNRKILLLDIGANADCKPQYLYQFALMGSLYSEKVLGIDKPRVALLSNGEEPTKGNATTQEAFSLISATSLNFVGNIEGRDLPRSAADVVVTDGFVGNVVLKLGEGLSEVLIKMIREELETSWLSKLAGLMLLPTFRRLKHRIDYTEVGGAPLLGVDGVCIVAHGRSNARAIQSALHMAIQAAEQDIVEVITQGIQHRNEGEPNVQRNKAGSHV